MKKNGTVSFFLIMTLILLFSYNTYSGEYVLVDGRGVEVCEAYEKNLNSFKDFPVMSCERYVNPKFRDFRKPEWKKIDVWNKKESMKPVIEYVEPNISKDTLTGKPNNDTYLRRLREKLENRAIFISETKVDIDNDGNLEEVLKYDKGGCGSAHYYGIILLVLENKGDKVDVGKTREIILEDAGRGYTMYDVFIYKNVTYFDRWSDLQWPELKNEKSLLKVFTIRDNRRTEVCRYLYDKQSKKGGK